MENTKAIATRDHYRAANQAFRDAAAEHARQALRYRSMQIGDDEYLASRHAMEKAERALTAAEAAMETADESIDWQR